LGACNNLNEAVPVNNDGLKTIHQRRILSLGWRDPGEYLIAKKGRGPVLVIEMVKMGRRRKRAKHTGKARVVPINTN